MNEKFFIPDLAKAEDFCLTDFKAALTFEQMHKFEKADKFGINRRIMLTTLTRSKQELLKGFIQHKEDEIIFETMDLIEDYQKHLKELMIMSESAIARLRVVAHAMLSEGEVKSMDLQ